MPDDRPADRGDPPTPPEERRALLPARDDHRRRRLPLAGRTMTATEGAAAPSDDRADPGRGPVVVTGGRAAYPLRDFLTRNRVDFRYLDDADATEALCVLPDGTRLTSPSIADLASALGLRRPARLETYDLVIVGAGPAGLAAAVYAASEGLATAILESHAPGGRPARAAGSRTTSASPTASAAPSSPSAPARRPSGSAPSSCSPARSAAAARATGCSC
jgi:NADPH-dependent 2,4-dienoyl-CoA reductase/sulfur reductase-like enzyme